MLNCPPICNALSTDTLLPVIYCTHCLHTIPAPMARETWYNIVFLVGGQKRLLPLISSCCLSARRPRPSVRPSALSSPLLSHQGGVIALLTPNGVGAPSIVTKSQLSPSPPPPPHLITQPHLIAFIEQLRTTSTTTTKCEYRVTPWDLKTCVGLLGISRPYSQCRVSLLRGNHLNSFGKLGTVGA